jgi:putative nucleotidyltransferase with HDIG domain
MPPVRFLTSLAQALSTMTLYSAGHPARERAVDASFERLDQLLADAPRAQFSFLGRDVVFGQRTLRDLADWDWGERLAHAGVQRLELARVSREEYGDFLDDVLARLTLAHDSTSVARPERPTAIRFGPVGIRGTGLDAGPAAPMPVATISYGLAEEAAAVRWVHDEVEDRGTLPLAEAEAVVRSLSVAMHEDGGVVMPLLQLREFDEYTTTHSLNVSVLAMALAEFLGLGAKDVRAYGVAGLLHDLGKVRIPKEILTKPGKLTDEEWAVMRRHPADGARMILDGDRNLDLAAAVAYEHHVMLDGGGYPGMHYCRECHQASRLVHVCDVYDALRTKRPYRDAWEPDRTLEYIEGKAGTEFDPELVRAFVAMMRRWERRPAVLAPAETPAHAPAHASAETATEARADVASGPVPPGTP